MEKLIKVKVTPDSKKNSIEKLKEDEFKITTKSPAEQGKANQSVINILSEYFRISPEKIVIIKGHTSSSKIVKIYMR